MLISYAPLHCILQLVAAYKAIDRFGEKVFKTFKKYASKWCKNVNIWVQDVIVNPFFVV